MRVEQKRWTTDGWSDVRAFEGEASAQLVLAFGGKAAVMDADRYNEMKEMYPDANIISCSTAGEILETSVTDDQIGLAAVAFDSTELKFAQESIDNADQSEEVGAKLAGDLAPDGLQHVLVFSDGTKVNGTGLVKGLTDNLPESVSVTGGLVGDGANFKETAVGFNAAATPGSIVVVGLYGDSIEVGYGSLGGWDPFGPERTISKADGGVLFELDGQPALKLYKEYLGDQAKDLPGSGLLFPLALEVDGVEVVRTLLGVDEEAQSMTFAGTMPEGVKAKLMKANFDRLVEGAAGAAALNADNMKDGAQLGILISCIGRKLVLKERIEDEIDAVREKLGENVPLIGFYSYGEICPTSPTEKQCQLHNQTMTITTLREK